MPRVAIEEQPDRMNAAHNEAKKNTRCMGVNVVQGSRFVDPDCGMVMLISFGRGLMQRAVRWLVAISSVWHEVKLKTRIAQQSEVVNFLITKISSKRVDVGNGCAK